MNYLGTRGHGMIIPTCKVLFVETLVFDLASNIRIAVVAKKTSRRPRVAPVTRPENVIDHIYGVGNPVSPAKLRPGEGQVPWLS